MTAHTSTRLTLPAPRDYRNAADTLHDAHDAVESIEWRLRAIVNAYETSDPLDQPPELDDVGALCSFVNDVERVIRQLTTKHDELRRELDEIDVMRLDSYGLARDQADGRATPAATA